MSLTERYIDYTIDCYDRGTEPMKYDEWFAYHQKQVAYAFSKLPNRERAYRAYTSQF